MELDKENILHKLEELENRGYWFYPASNKSPFHIPERVRLPSNSIIEADSVYTFFKDRKFIIGDSKLIEYMSLTQSMD